jgi:hypothetical protein
MLLAGHSRLVVLMYTPLSIAAVALAAGSAIISCICVYQPKQLASFFSLLCASCRSCFEVSCVDSDFSDGYGAKMDRSSACYDTSKSVVIKIVDR